MKWGGKGRLKEIMKAFGCLLAILSITQILVPSFSIAADQEPAVPEQETQKSSTFETDLLDVFSKKAGKDVALTNIPPLYTEPQDAG